jgi:broad specificity phosphatase PhoE
MKILIIRHAEPDYSIDSLTPKGWREAELLSRRLVELGIDDFYSSPQGRARDTARPTLEKCGKEAEILPWLMEFSATVQIDGKEALPFNLRPQFWTGEPELFDREKWLEHPLMRSGNVRGVYQDSVAQFDALLARYGYIRDGYLYRCEENRDVTICLFCHFAKGMVLLSHLTGISPVLLWQGLFLPASSVTTIVTEEREKGEVFFKCMQLGDTSHLYAGGEPVSRAGLFPEFYVGETDSGAKA